jgi:competence protein ComEC
MRDPLVLPVLSILSGIGCAHLAIAAHWPADPVSASIGALGCAILGILAIMLGLPRAPKVACLAAFLFAGGLLEIAHQPAPPPRLDVPDLSLTVLTGCLVETPLLVGEKEQFTLELAHHARARVSFYVRPGEQAPDLRYGRRFEVEGKLRIPRNFGNPDAFDYRTFLARQDIYWTLSAITLKPLDGNCGNKFDAAISALRGGALERIASLYHGDRYDTAMADAILLGENSGMERVWTDDYRSTGTFHAIVISGLHVAVLGAVLLLLLRLLFVPRIPATVLMLLAIWLYALVTGWHAPAIRSASGMTLFAIGSLFYRDRRMLNILAAVALLFVLFDPDQLFDASFQLSFLAVGFLAIFAVPVLEATSEPLKRATSGLRDAKRDPALDSRVAAHRVQLRLYAATARALFRLPIGISRVVVCTLVRVGVFFFDISFVSLVMQVGLALPMAIYFHRLSISGLSANAIVVPLLALVMPIGFLAIATNSHWIAAITALLLELSRRTVAWHANIEPNWRIPSPPLLLSIAICATLAAAAIGWKHRLTRNVSLAALAGLIALLIASPFRPVLDAGDLSMTAIDVGQGDSIFLTFPDGKTMLVDGGGFPKFGNREQSDRPPIRMDIGEDVVAPYLWSRRVKRIDVIAISHLHDDHAGGVPALLNDFAVAELWVGVTPDCEIWRRIQDVARRRGTRVRRFWRGDAFPWGGTQLEVLEPTREYTPGAQPTNNDSGVLRVTFRSRSFLLTGDIEKPVENEVSSGDRWPHADVLKVAHHGSKSSSTPGFLDQVHPALALISDGWGNLYGHPHAVTLDSLRERHIAAYRTDLDGAVTIVSDGWKIWRE